MGASTAAQNFDEWINGVGRDAERNLHNATRFALEEARRQEVTSMRIECRSEHFDGGSSRQEWSSLVAVDKASEATIVEGIRGRLVQAPGETFSGTISVRFKDAGGKNDANLQSYQRVIRPFQGDKVQVAESGAAVATGGAGVPALDEYRNGFKLLMDQQIRLASVTTDGISKLMEAASKVVAAHTAPAASQGQGTAWGLADRLLQVAAANPGNKPAAQNPPPPPPPTSAQPQLAGPVNGAAGLELPGLSDPKDLPAAAPAEAGKEAAPVAQPAPVATPQPPLRRSDVERWANENPEEAKAMVLEQIDSMGMALTFKS